MHVKTKIFCNSSAGFPGSVPRLRRAKNENTLTVDGGATAIDNRAASVLQTQRDVFEEGPNPSTL